MIKQRFRAVGRMLPLSVRCVLRKKMMRFSAGRALVKGGYDTSAIRAWADALGGEADDGIQWAWECARLEQQTYFRPGIFSSLWPGLGKTETLIAATDNCLHGLHLERTLLGNWQGASNDDAAAEFNMIRVLNESVLHAVRFCGGWEEAHAGRGYPGNPPMQRLAGLFNECPGRALDLGAGGIPFFPILRQRAGWMASDLNLPALRIMRHALDLEPGHLVCHDAQILPFPERSFHVVVSRYIIENVLRPGDLMREVARVLCPGGSFLLPVNRSMFQRSASRYFTNRNTFRSMSEFDKLWETAGLERVRFYEEESVLHARKPGRLDPGCRASGFKRPDSSECVYDANRERIRFADGGVYPCVDEIPILIPQHFLHSDFGRLGSFSGLQKLRRTD